MADATHRSLLNAVRTWLKAALSLTDDQVIPEDEPGPRPGLPYLSVKLLVQDNALGPDSTFATDADPPQWHVEGAREDTVSVHGWGRGSDDLLRNAVIRLQWPSVQEAMETVGANVIPIGSIQNASAYLDTDVEHHFVRDVWLRYRVTSDAEEVVEATSAQVDLCTPESTVYDLP